MSDNEMKLLFKREVETMSRFIHANLLELLAYGN